MKNSDYTLSDIYQGGYSSLASTSNGYMTAGSFGMPTDPRTANILQEVSTKLQSGVKNIEITGVSPEICDSIPQQQLKEVHRLSKLTGVDVTLHGPVMDVGIHTVHGHDLKQRMRETVSELCRQIDEAGIMLVKDGTFSE